MPLLKYFVVIGALLTALLLLLDIMLEPSKAEIARLASARSDTTVPKPRIASRVGQHAVGIPVPTPAPVAWPSSPQSGEHQPTSSDSTAETSAQSTPALASSDRPAQEA